MSSHPAPPMTLDRDLELSPSEWSVQEIYRLLTALVVPRPIAWVSTLSADGVANVAPHSYFNMVSISPPHVVFSSSGVKDTLTNIRTSGEFVINIASQDVVEQMNASSAQMPLDEDEFAWFGIERTPSRIVAPPRVAACKAHLECRLSHEIPVGNAYVIIGEVVHLRVSPGAWSAGGVDEKALDPVCRLSGTRYAGLGDVFDLPRPVWEEIRNAPAEERVARR